MPTSTNTIAYTNRNNLADSILLKEGSRTTFINLLECHMQKLKPAVGVEAAIVNSAPDTNAPAASAVAESSHAMRCVCNQNSAVTMKRPTVHRGAWPNEPTPPLRHVCTAYRTNPRMTLSPEAHTNAKRT
jgi:hypothetical protein